MVFLRLILNVCCECWPHRRQANSDSFIGGHNICERPKALWELASPAMERDAVQAGRRLCLARMRRRQQLFGIQVLN